MTTRLKIIIGFSFVIIVLICLSIFAYTQLDESTDGFTAYRAEARMAVFANAGDALLREAAVKTQTFTSSPDPKLIDAAVKDIEAGGKYVADARELETTPASFSILDEQLARFTKIVAAIELYRTKLLAALKLRDEETLPTGRLLNNQLSALMTSASASDPALLVSLDEAYSAYVETRVLIRAYVVEQQQEIATDASRYLQDLITAVQKMDSLFRSEESRKAYALLRDNCYRYQGTASNLIALVAEAKAAKLEIEELTHAASSIFDSYTAQVQQEMFALGAATLAGNERAQILLISGSLVGVILGLAFALWIIYGVTRVLKLVSRFASDVARGEFNTALPVREGGEIGAMARAIMEIPEVLSNVMSQGKQLAESISIGSFRTRFDTNKFNGGFGDLAGCINNVCDAYTGVLDSIPTPLMTGDKNCSIRFLNKEAQRVLGSNQVGKKCADILNTKECNTQGCFGRRAIDGNSPYNNEVTLHPHGKRIEANVVAAPLHNPAGKTEGFMEVITDITAMKDTQSTMLGVAQEAQTIADRVAAAAEELSAQVEQVSRGAEMQRERVHATAAAMTEMNAAVLEVARSAGNASEQSEDTRKKADGGADLVHKVVESITDINNVALALQNNMEDLGKQAESIGGVMNVISDIADQTNLLALNAAIEAARAGEAGRGFAVVADEVRKLAEKTMGATQEVGTNIKAIQNSTLANIKEVTTAVANIGEATGLSTASGQALREIVDLAAANSSVVAAIATAAEEQSATSEEITNALEEVNRIVGETTDGMTQASAAVHDLAETAHQLKAVVERLR